MPAAKLSPAFVEIADGHRLFVRDWGRGRPIVLLAGWGQDSRIWGETMLALNGAGLRTIAYDRRGHGRSTDLEITDYDCLANDLASVLDTLDLDEVTLVAHSGAGGEVLRYVSRHGSRRLRSIVLAACTGPRMLAGADNPDGVSAGMAELLYRRLATDLSGWIDDNIGPFAPGTPERVNEWMSHMLLDCSRSAVIDFQRVILEADLRDDAAALDVPVTVIHGDRDVSAPIGSTARRYAAIIPGAALLVYEGVAHGLMVTHAEQLAADIARRAR